MLNKPGPLTAEEFAHVTDHVRIGLEILAPLEHMPVVLDYVSDHHEHFDALASRRAFRNAMPAAATVSHLESFVGRVLDPDVFVAVKRVVLRRKTLTFIDARHALHT